MKPCTSAWQGAFHVQLTFSLRSTQQRWHVMLASQSRSDLDCSLARVLDLSMAGSCKSIKSVCGLYSLSTYAAYYDLVHNLVST